jgi:hypothetical protein
MTVPDLTDMIGKRLLVGITYLDGVGEVADHLQFVGTVQAVAPLVAIDWSDEGDEPSTLPPDPDAYEPAAPGEYRTHTTGEVVVDPDYLTTWTVRADSE